MKKVIKKETFNYSKKNKLVAYVTALTLGITSLSVPTYAKTSENIEVTYLNYDERLSALNSIYQKQMSYLAETIKELKSFYNEQDTKDIIKNAYPEAYQVLDHDFNVNIISYGTSSSFIPNIDLKDSKSYVDLIKENNRLIRNLKIKPAGNGRDPEYGIIKDETASLGFRIKTEEDKKLIDEYTTILKNPIIINETLINFLSTDIEDITKEDLINTLESILNDQINYIKTAQKELKTFYNEIDIKDTIKNAYVEAFNVANTSIDYLVGFDGTKYFVVRNSNLPENELINNYINMIKENNKLIRSLKIKPAGNGRDPEYGVIKDETSPYGLRLKTKEDEEIIEKYNNTIGNIDYIPENTIEYLETVSNEKTNALVKKYENR